MVDKIEIGMIGLSAGNGHPYSFSCIINGYDDAGLKASGWDGIYNYVRKRDQSEFTFPGVAVTHIWTQDAAESNRIAKAAKIPFVVDSYLDMLGKVNAVIIGRDDYETHLPFAKPFLEAGCFVYIDKPLTLDKEELKYFLPYLQQGKLMSCSGLRYAMELDELRANKQNVGEIKLVRGAVLNDFSKYGIHMLDAIFNCIPFQVKSLLALQTNHQSVVLFNEDNSIIHIDALGDVVKTFQLDFFGSKGRFHTELNDNFSAFRRTLYHFIKMIREGKPAIEPSLTLSIMKIIMAYAVSLKEGRMVKLSEVHV